MSDKTEPLGLAIDRLDSTACGLVLPLPPSQHLAMLKEILPEIVRELKAGFVQVTGENPWEGEP